MFEINGDAYMYFTPSMDRTTLGLTWANGTRLPYHWHLLLGTCGNFTKIADGAFSETEDNILYFVFDSLQLGQTYYFRLEGNTGDDYVLTGYTTESIQQSGTCGTTVCNLVQNPSFDEPEANINSNNPVGGAVASPGNPATAFANQACGWELVIPYTQTQGCNTPDYYLAPRSANYTSPPCTTANAIGNSCITNIIPHTGNGVMHLFSIDRNSIKRREYIYTRLNTPANNTLPIETNGIYYVSMWARTNAARRTRSSAIQLLVTDQATMQNNPLTDCEPIANWGTPFVDFSSTYNNTLVAWQQAATITQYTGAGAEFLVIGNFLSNQATQPFLWNDPQMTATTLADDIPSLFIDDVEIIQLPDAGVDQTLCDISQLQPLGNLYCWFYNNTLQTKWYDANNTYLGSTLPFTPTITQPGTYTYRLEISYNGETFDDYVTVYLAPQVTVDPILDNNCDPINGATYYVNNLLPGSTVNVTSPNATFTWSINSGTLSIHNAIINSANGIGTINLTGTLLFNGISCPINQSFNIYECCVNASQVDFFFPQNSTMSTQLATLGTTTISSLTFVIAGNVTVDDNYTFDDCHFYFMPDATLTVQSNLMVNANTCSFQPCGEYRWDELFIQPDAFFFMTQSTFDGAIRGIHITNQSGLFLEDNTFDNNYNSVFIENYSSSPMLIVRGNTFICEEIGHAGLVQGPLSTVPFANPQYNYVTGIMVLNSQNVTLGQAAQSINTFTTTSPTNPAVNSELSYINLFNSQDISIENNRFGAAYAAIWATQSDFMVGGSVAQKNIFWPAAYSPGALPYHSTAIYGSFSSATITYNEFKDLETAIVFERSGLILEGYQATTIAHNPIIEADYPIQFYNPVSTGSRVLINNNTNISARVKAITFTDYVESDPPQVYINTNSINVNTPQSGLARKGIELKNCDAIIVGDNNLNINGLYFPSGASNVIGIHINGSIDPVGSRLSGNTIASFDMGLVMENDQGTTLFSCMDFNTCYTSVLYKNITASKVQDVNDFNSPGGSTASANVTFVNNVNPSYPVVAQNCSINYLANWHYNGIGNNPDPTSTSTYQNIFNYPTSSAILTNNCNSLPSSKTEPNNFQPKLEVLMHPNPSNDGHITLTFNRYLNGAFITLYDLNGHILNEHQVFGEVINLEYQLSTGIYILLIEDDKEVVYEKLVITK